MIIGLIADIHGNIQAMTTVLHELYARRVDLILCAGDLVCYGAHPNHVITMVRQCSIPSVAGNYDYAVSWDLPSASRKASSPQTEPLKQAALDWTKTAIHSHHRDFLRSLPWAMDFVLEGKRIHLLHAGPTYLDEWLSVQQPHELAQVATQFNADFVFLGHTHEAYVHRVKQEGGRRTIVVNPGSVGRSLDGDTRAAFAIFDTTSEKTELCRIDYDIDIAVQAILRSDMPSGIALLLRHGARRIEQLPQAALAQSGTLDESKSI